MCFTVFLFKEELLSGEGSSRLIAFMLLMEGAIAFKGFYSYSRLKKEILKDDGSFEYGFFCEPDGKKEMPFDGLSFVMGVAGVVVSLFLLEAWDDMPPEYKLSPRELWRPLEAAVALGIAGIALTVGKPKALRKMAGRIISSLSLLTPLYFLLTGPRPPVQ